MSKIQQIDIGFLINPKLIGEGVTQSEMQTWDNCSEKWYLKYNLMLELRGGFSWAALYGSWIHAALEEFYKTKGRRWSLNCTIPHEGELPMSVLKDKEYWVGLAQIQMEAYTSRYKHDAKIWKVKKTEFIADIEFEGVRLKGMIDVFVKSLVHGGYYVVDHKTCTRLDPSTVMGWDFRLQFMFYCWLATKLWPKRRIKGYFINAMRKPALRLKKGESVASLLSRVRTDMRDKPENYFYRDRLRLTKGKLEHFETHILRPKLARVKLLMDPKVPMETKAAIIRSPNTDYCTKYGAKYACEFIKLCRNGWAVEKHAFRKRDVKHTELEDGEVAEVE